jgi:hypothetical protein
MREPAIRLKDWTAGAPAISEPEKGGTMSSIVTALFDTEEAVNNALDDLVATGIPRDRIAADKDQWSVSITIGSQAEPEITEILKRHEPLDIHARSRR